MTVLVMVSACLVVVAMGAIYIGVGVTCAILAELGILIIFNKIVNHTIVKNHQRIYE